MTRTGGPSTAAGISFQALAIARAIVDVYLGKYQSVRAEVPLQADFGQAGIIPVSVDDYVIQYDARRIYHQAKTNAPGGGTWTPIKLCQEEILQKFKKQSEDDSSSECCLVTSSDCPLLGEIANRVRAAIGFKEFEANITAGHRKIIDEACRELGIVVAELYQLLLRCRLEIRTAEQFKADLKSISLIEFADPDGAINSLRILALEAMETGQLFDEEIIKIRFSESSVFHKPKATERELVAATRDASSRLRTVGKDIGGVHIQQSAVDKLLEWVNNPDFTKSSVAALLDQAGSGKTVAMSMLLKRLEDAGFVVLGIKVDGLAFSTAEELASVIGLPATIPSVIQSLKTTGHRIALLIDQVDALSSAMARESSSISVVLDLVARTAGLGIPIVLACRSFDWKYDYRLRQLRDAHPTELALPEFTDEQLMQVLSVCVLKLSDLHPSTVKVIRCPLRLKVFFEVVQEKRRADPSWMPRNAIYSMQTLYQDYWALKMSKAISDGIHQADCEKVVELLARRMQDSELLSAPEAMVATYGAVTRWLISEGVVCSNGKLLSFFHQTFFDFILARWFVGNSYSLVKHLLESDQGLFYRPMVRQILEYTRDANPIHYLSELKEIIENPTIRKHLRWLTVMWLGQNRDPIPEELKLLEPMLSIDDTRRRILDCLSGSSAWFDLLTAQRFDRWLRTLPDADSFFISRYLRSVISERQREIVKLLSPYIGKSDSWNNQIAICLAEIRSDWDDCSIDLFFEVLGSPLTNLEMSFGWWATALMSLAKSEPTRACKAIRIILNRFTARWTSKNEKDDINIAVKSKNSNLRLPIAHEFAETLSLLGSTAPAEFLENTLSWTLDAMQNSCSSYGNLSFKTNWREWSYRDSHSDATSEKLLYATSTAVKNLAKSKPEAFRALIPTLLDNPCLPIQVIIAEAYRENPLEFASDAAMFLITDPRRLRLSVRGSSSWNTAELIKACSLCWTKVEFGRVETAVLTMKQDPVTSVNDLCWSGRTHLELLHALDRKKLSAKGQDLLGQLERKFPLFETSPPRQNEAGFVGAPIRQNSIKKMNDKCWLLAMRKYVSNGMRGNKPIALSGGRIELAGALQAAAKEQPERFHALAMNRMDATFHIDYVLAIIEGISEAGLPVERVERLIQKFLTQLEQDNIRTVAWAIEKYAGKDIPQSLIDLLRHWVEHAAYPVIKSDLTEARGIDQGGIYNLVTDGMNSDRGAALRTLAAILLKSDPPRRGEYLDIAETVAADPSAAVRAVCIDFLNYAIPADPIRACDLFRKLIGQNQLLLREQEACDFVYYSLHRHANEVMWAIERMLADERSPQTRETGAKLACLAAFKCSEAAPLRDVCIKGDVPVRKGAAIVYSANITDALVGRECQQRLPLLLDDEDAEVRKEATAFLRDLEASCIRELEDFLRAWAQTKSLGEGAENAAYMLQQNPVVNPKLTLEISERLIDALGQEITNLQSRHGIVSYHLTPAILNVYHLSTDIGTRRKAIDLFEKLDELGCSGIYSAMESVDRL
jgi:hypothetical protein